MSSSFARLGCDNNPLRLFWNSWTEAGASTPPFGSWVLPVCEHGTLSFVKKNLSIWNFLLKRGTSDSGNRVSPCCSFKNNILVTPSRWPWAHLSCSNCNYVFNQQSLEGEFGSHFEDWRHG